MKFTIDQVIGLAPDHSSVTAAKKQASVSKWPLSGHSDEALWGHCRGSGKNPYEVSIDLNGPAFKCSCPSRKFPCKHSLALMLMHANGLIEENAVPDWVNEWLQKRIQREQTRVTMTENKANRKTDPELREKRQAKRIKTIQQGLSDCETWLKDLVAPGFSSLQNQSYAVFDNAAARLVDAQAPGVAGIVSLMGQTALSGSPKWLEDVTRLTGRLIAVIRAFYRYDKLSPEQQADIRTIVGWPIEKDAVLAGGQTVSGRWIIMGESIRSSEKMKEQRVWLYEPKSDKTALILNFAFVNQPMDVSLIPGMCFDAELAFYPGTYPIRALIKNRSDYLNNTGTINTNRTIEQALFCLARVKILNPFFTLLPMLISPVLPIIKDDSLFLYDDEGRCIPVNQRFNEKWEMVAISGGRGITVAGEWENQTLLPLGCWQNEEYYEFKTELSL